MTPDEKAVADWIMDDVADDCPHSRSFRRQCSECIEGAIATALAKAREEGRREGAEDFRQRGIVACEMAAVMAEHNPDRTKANRYVEALRQCADMLREIPPATPADETGGGT